MKIIITGGQGFTGRAVIKNLLNRGDRVLSLVRGPVLGNSHDNLRNLYVDKNSLNAVKDFVRDFVGAEPVTVVHAATKFVSRHGLEDISSLVRSNIEFGTELLEILSDLPSVHFINLSSSWQENKSKLGRENSLYATTKNDFLRIVSDYTSSELKFSNVYLFDTYGVWDTRNKIVYLLLGAAKSNEKLDMTSGNQLINLLHINDVANGIIKLTDMTPANQHFELSSLETYSIKQLSAEIERVIGKPLMLNWGVLENHKSDIYQKRAIAPLVPDWSPTISLEAGIKDLWTNLNATRN
jgi:CDP-3, 6-dideoxy-D-glycero-L-glycero-4-hexulose-4-reductase